MKDNDELLEDPNDDTLAAEYALGLLTLTERHQLDSRSDHDLDFARRVGQWQDRFFPLATAFQAADLPGSVKQDIDQRLFGIDAQKTSTSTWWSSLAVWRGFSAAMAAAFILAIALPFVVPSTPQPRLIAQLTAESGNVAYLAVYDTQSRSIRLAHVKGSPSADHVFQLWVAQGTEAPISLGVLPTGPNINVAVDERISTIMTDTAHMAISLEPPGGSPTGQPTGPIQALGDLIKI